ncbi:MAG: hypothetical protein FJ279_05570 [Planctomycetes bacterium]|nr:hypothetical protein [Planctomycetota bacterium]MBM4087584.1 hypothetical protein [Planctomycetota bacterium]
MVLTELEQSVRSLSRAEKLELIRFISTELLKDERLEHFEQRESLGVWSPHDEHAAAEQLRKLLERMAASPRVIQIQGYREP